MASLTMPPRHLEAMNPSWPAIARLLETLDPSRSYPWGVSIQVRKLEAGEVSWGCGKFCCAWSTAGGTKRVVLTRR